MGIVVFFLIEAPETTGRTGTHVYTIFQFWSYLKACFHDIQICHWIFATTLLLTCTPIECVIESSQPYKSEKYYYS